MLFHPAAFHTLPLALPATPAPAPVECVACDGEGTVRCGERTGGGNDFIEWNEECETCEGSGEVEATDDESPSGQSLVGGAS